MFLSCFEGDDGKVTTKQ